MSLELIAAYQLHRFQIILNAKDRDGEYQFPQAFLYAVANEVFPLFHSHWCRENDPYLDLYNVKKELVEDVTKYLDDLWTKKQPIPSFYELEAKYGHDQRVELIITLRYCFLDDRFDPSFYQAILKASQYPVEADSICREFSDSDLSLV